jgi:hypothetical protein
MRRLEVITGVAWTRAPRTADAVDPLALTGPAPQDQCPRLGLSPARALDQAHGNPIARATRTDQQRRAVLAPAARPLDRPSTGAVTLGQRADSHADTALTHTPARPDAATRGAIRVAPGRPDRHPPTFLSRTLPRPAPLRPDPPPPYTLGDPEAAMDYDEDTAYLPPYVATQLAIQWDYREGVPRYSPPYALDGHAAAPWRAALPAEPKPERPYQVALSTHDVWRYERRRPPPDRTPNVPIPVETDRFIIPARPLYHILHALSCVRLPERTPLPWRSASLRCQMPEWAWSLSLDLVGPDAAALIQPDGDDPVEIEITLNGARWICIAEDWEQTTGFGAATVTRVTGRSLSAYLSGRYRRPRAYTEPAQRLAAQLAEQELPTEDPWTIVWQAQDWLVPAGAWSYQQLAPIQAIARIAAAAGALIYPDPAARKLMVRQIYQAAPWEMISGLEHLLVPECALLGSLVRRYRWPDQANAVHVYGGAVGCLQGRIYRAETAGDALAAEVQDDLMTDPDVLRALGRRHLAAQSQPAGITRITLPIDQREDFPVIRLGDIVRVDIDGGQMAPCTAIDISVTLDDTRGPSVRQTLGLGETQSDYQRLLALLPQSPVILAQVATAYGDGTLACTTVGGGTVRVIGSAAVGAWVWCQNGRVLESAPAMPAYDLPV